MLPVSLLALCAYAAASTPTAASSNYTVASGWFASWHVADVPLSSVLWSKYTHMVYAFATPTADPKTLFLAESDEELLPQFVAAAHKNGVKAGLSIGGWGGSTYFSSNVASASNRTSFVNSVTNLIQKYRLDLVDFDWEYPGVQGIGCNIVSASDTDNFLLMLQELRASPVAANVTLTAATAVVPFPTTTNSTATVAQFATVLDWIVPMVYDLSWNWTAGAPRIQRALPSAPLDDACFADTPGAGAGDGSGLAGLGSARSAVEAWAAAGIPRAQIVLGVPAYGHSFDVNASAAFLAPASSSSGAQLAPYPPYDTLNHTIGDKWDGAPAGGVNQCGDAQGPGGTWNFFALVAAGLLLPNGSAAPGVPHRWDACSATPYVYAAKAHPGDGGVLISYVDPASFAAKGAFARANGLAGFSMWEVGGDPKGVLLDAMLSAATNASLTVTASTAAAAATQPPASASASASTTRFESSGAVGEYMSSSVYDCRRVNVILVTLCLRRPTNHQLDLTPPGLAVSAHSSQMQITHALPSAYGF
ncbi:glycoside hydrolase family 18 protein [Mycena pura]|uniref:Glycoside hydrolase family 18 protein n=1 Tax=Mycena pura TaxID=153505 RepID=A0AAD6VIZ9_9AGAR|nr:glycoside hydrolase family 18 protein [Mycena pura]